ncbi:probable proline--tRNA ligase, mitochondrial [Strongylocentrotus purpuratus]|uniref:Probable proline--tRNA ligase, mitochondrial n=1 Tax=Strongylocentrotus purpuratus TaxID=7668 RepID=A0A7M7PHG5_STRPU|nr:probable proline--tRNA ligase, mitochondrial [Strongylocentrotus purpuratus]
MVLIGKRCLSAFCQRVSKMYQPSFVLPEGSKVADVKCKSHRLMMEAGLIRQASPGTFHLLPLAMRALEKLIKVIDTEMQKVGGQKIAMPGMTPSSLWKTSGRYSDYGPELITLQDRHNVDYCLGPTHEEAVTDIVAGEKTLSHKRLPIKLYQITNKFRDEMRPRYGLLRGREFLMKDLYTFDSNLEGAEETYRSVCEAYQRIFSILDLPIVQAVGATGAIGGSSSHEFHLLSEIGEDHVYHCSRCGYAVNQETVEGVPSCRDHLSTPDCTMSLRQGIEVGHAFLLGTKYSKTFKADFFDKDGKPQLAEMGCYGLGVTRILAAAIEVLSSEKEIRWPQIIAPYQVCIVSPKEGGAERSAIHLAEWLYQDVCLHVPHLAADLLLDDRGHMTIGRRVKDAAHVGYPLIVVVGKRALEADPKFEVINTASGSTEYLSKVDLLQRMETITVL